MFQNVAVIELRAFPGAAAALEVKGHGEVCAPAVTVALPRKMAQTSAGILCFTSPRMDARRLSGKRFRVSAQRGWMIFASSFRTASSAAASSA